MINKPNFFIVGACKSGTTSLSYLLQQHPGIYINESVYVEPAYFAKDTGINDLDTYLNIFQNVRSETAVGEKSVAYLYDPYSAEKIKKFAPNAKIIIMLRNPIEVSFSLFNHNRSAGVEPVSDFFNALCLEDERYTLGVQNKLTGYHANFYYIRRALYYNQVKRYYNIFPPENILIILYHVFKDDQFGVCRKVYQFLGVSTDMVPNIYKKNQGGLLRYPIINYLYASNRFVNFVVRHCVPEKIRKTVREINFSEKSYKVGLPAEVRQLLYSRFKKDVDLLESEYNIQVPLV